MTIMETSPQEKNSSAASFFSPMRDLRGAKLHWQSALRTVIIEQESLWNVMEDMSWAKQRKWSPEPACPAQQKNRWGVEKMSCGEGTGVPGRPGRRLPGRLWKPPLHWALLGVLWFSCPRHWALGQSLGLWLGGLCGWTTPLSRPNSQLGPGNSWQTCQVTMPSLFLSLSHSCSFALTVGCANNP